MNAQTKPLSEITEQAIDLLTKELGLVATLRFLTQASARTHGVRTGYPGIGTFTVKPAVSTSCTKNSLPQWSQDELFPHPPIDFSLVLSTMLPVGAKSAGWSLPPRARGRAKSPLPKEGR
ncbi:MAG: hypothetical protein QOJ16_2581 [Acidobacteriota bacterium]|jgi:hypothetical protein|nr:hypothetical protein [Acidobacteriota bacterium]